MFGLVRNGVKNLPFDIAIRANNFKSSISFAASLVNLQIQSWSAGVNGSLSQPIARKRSSRSLMAIRSGTELINTKEATRHRTPVMALVWLFPVLWAVLNSFRNYSYTSTHGYVSFGGFTLQISVVWWLLLTAAATWVLLRTRAGNWVFAVGGDQNSARQVGVPVMRTKIGLFMTTALAAWLVGMLQLFKTSTVQASTGVGQEFIYIICAVVGGCLLTGGYGSAIGAALGALIYGMTLQGIVFAQWDNNWLKAFLGVMLLGAVLVNNWIRRRAEVRK